MPWGDAPRPDAIAIYADRVVFIEQLIGDTAYITECEIEAGAQAYNERKIDLSAQPPLGYIYLRFGVSSGQCGDAVSWELTNEGLLRIYGEGPMWDYVDSPWVGKAVDRVDVSEGVTAIGAGAFTGVQIKSVTIADTVTGMGPRAFKDCARLRRVALPAGLTAIPEQAFVNCWQLKQVDLPGGLTAIESDAFWRSALSEINLPEGLERIAEGAFARTDLTGIALPASLTSLDPLAFQECCGIAHITVAQGSAAYAAIDDALYTRDGATLVYCAPARTGRFQVADGTRSIGEYAFGCSSLSEIALPEGLEVIEDGAFSQARALERLNLPASLMSIGSGFDAEALTVQAVYGTPGMDFCRRADARHVPGGAVADYVLTSPPADAALVVGERLRLTGATGCASDHPECVSVTADGLATALIAGAAEITHAGGHLRVTVADPYTPTRIDIDCADDTLLPMDRTLPLRVRFTPDTAACDIRWQSSDTTVATVDARGVVNPVGEGMTTVTAQADGLTAAVRLEVINPYKCREIILDQGGVVLLDITETLKLNATLVPSTSRTTVTWSSANPAIAQVSQDGLVTPVSKGTVRITAATGNRLSASVRVKVADLYTPIKVKLDRSGTVKLRVGEEVTLTAALTPATARTSLSWTTSDSAVAGGSSRGDTATILGRRPGTATITVTTENGKTAKVRVKVVK